MIIILLLLVSLIQPSLSFYVVTAATYRVGSSTRLHEQQQIDRQSDKSKYGRGIDHISADLNEGDVIAYQAGTWYVDGTEVGDGSPAIVRYMQVDTVQIVWTHDCEHGLVYGLDIIVADADVCGSIIKKGDELRVDEETYVQCGPEQILCRIPVSFSEQTSSQMKISCVDFDPADEMMLS